jgi:tetratricopeptide (TPR) repeat protein
VVVLGLAAQAHAESLDAALARANAEHKPIVVEMGAEWCKPCKMWEADILPDPRVQSALASVILLRYDVDEEQGGLVARRFNISSFPSFLIVDLKGNAQQRWEGTPDGDPGVQQFLEVIAAAPSALDTEASVFARLKAHPGELQIELDAARWYAQHKLLREALFHYEAVAAAPKADVLQRFTAASAGAHLRRVLQWREQLIGDKVSQIRAVPGLTAADDLILATVGSTLSPADAKALVAKVLEAQTDDELVNSYVYIALAAGATDAALAAAERVVAHKHLAQYLDTLAEVHHARGERDKALAVEDEAIALDPKLKELVTNRARFATSRQDSREVRTARARAEALRARFEHIDELPDADLPSDADPIAEATAARKAQTELVATVVKRCQAAAGATPVIYARVVIDKTRHVTGITPFADALTRPELRACISRELLGAVLPDTHQQDDADRLLTIRFAKP